MHISVVVPTFNRRNTLEVVLPSLLAQTFEGYEVLLCDAGSSDGTRELVESLGDPRLKFLPGADKGRAGARNRGVVNAQGEVVLFTDADIIADPGLLAAHWKRHQRHPGQAVVGCEIQVNSLEEYERFRQDPQAHARHKPTRETLPWHYFLTGNASVHRTLLLEAGCFDEDFTGYGHEDLELGYRLKRKALTIYYASEAVNYHWHPVPFDEQCQKMFLAGRSTVRFYRKYRDPRIALIMGWNPISWLGHSLLKAVPFLRKLAPREILLQYHYVSGIKAALGE